MVSCGEVGVAGEFVEGGVVGAVGGAQPGWGRWVGVSAIKLFPQLPIKNVPWVMTYE